MTDYIIYAPNVHQGGGRTLLLPILDILKDRENILFILDERLPLPDAFIFSGEVVRVRPTLISRGLLEYRLWRLVRKGTRLLGMGSLPPLLAHSDHIVVFIQNRYLVEDVSLRDFTPFIRWRIRIERWWLYTRAVCVSHFVVQTLTMRNLLRKKLWRDADILPFSPLPQPEDVFEGQKNTKQHDFLYVASGEIHKNHLALVKAWIELSRRGQFPRLCLTLDTGQYSELCVFINSSKERYGLKISVTGQLTYQEVQNLYHESRALIYPSSFESFGLPLLEAVAVGLPIAAADKEYVYDLINPTVTFDPDVPESIADAISSFSFVPASMVGKILDPKSFLEKVFAELGRS